MNTVRNLSVSLLTNNENTFSAGLNCVHVYLLLVTWHSGRTLVFDRRTFPCPALDLQLTGDHLCG